MKILIIGAGPLGSLYAYLFQCAGIDVTLLARGEHFEYLQSNGLTLVNEFSGEKATAWVRVIDRLHEEDEYDLAIVLMRKNSVRKLLPTLSKHKYLHHILFMGNNAAGFDEYLRYFPKEKVLFGFPGGGGSRIDHVVHYVDTEKPGGQRLPVILGEIDGVSTGRTRAIQELFEFAEVPVQLVDDIDSWLRYHVAFVLPLAGALLQSGDNYRLARDKGTMRRYVLAVREAGRVLKSQGFLKSYNPKFRLFYWLPVGLLTRILGKVFNSRFAEVAMMMHVKAARDEMADLAHEFRAMITQSGLSTPHLHELLDVITPRQVEELERYGAALEMPKEAMQAQGRIMMRALRRQFGFVGMLKVFLDMLLIGRQLRREHPKIRKSARKISKVVEQELFTFSALFLALAKRMGREEAYEFFKTEIMNEIARTSMVFIYQVKDLKRCEGDVFDNFKKMNLALFRRTTEEGTWLMDEYHEEPGKLTVKVTSCANFDLFNALGVPELGKFGCDHDLAGYPVIEDEVNCDFRRLCTIAKGSDHCLFEFYRKGTAPDNAHLNV